MKTFREFIAEAYDPELEGQASRAPGEGGRIRGARKKGEAPQSGKIKNYLFGVRILIIIIGLVALILWSFL